MSKVYDRCPPEVEARVAALIELHHSELKNAGVTLDLIFIGRDSDDDGVKPVLSHQGVPALAIASAISLKQRSKGGADVEILIDRDRYNDCTPAQQNALLDHELNHFELARDKDGAVKFDSALRPKIKMRQHDYDFGWFECVARRHGAASFEVQQAKVLWDEAGNTLFPFLTDAQVQSVPLPVPTTAQPIPTANETGAPENSADTGSVAAAIGETPAEPTAGANDTPTPEPEPPQLRQARWAHFFGAATARKLAPPPEPKKPAKSAEVEGAIQ